jgi:hypothetical protein
MMQTTVIRGKARHDREAQDWTPADRSKAILARIGWWRYLTLEQRLLSTEQRIEGILDAHAACDVRFFLDIDLDMLRAARINVTRILDTRWRAK